jgi:hypothetical protein
VAAVLLNEGLEAQYSQGLQSGPSSAGTVALYLNSVAPAKTSTLSAFLVDAGTRKDVINGWLFTLDLVANLLAAKVVVPFDFAGAGGVVYYGAVLYCELTGKALAALPFATPYTVPPGVQQLLIPITLTFGEC